MLVVFQVDIYLTGAETTDDTGLLAVRVPPVSSWISYVRSSACWSSKASYYFRRVRKIVKSDY
jgi:hypothetical protein